MLFMTIEIVGGIMANSIAILADAFHLLSDVLAYVISLQAVIMSYKKTPIFMTFGYVKVQPLGALINIAIIWFVTIELAIEATERIAHKSMVEDPLYMLLTSFFGLGCNLYIMKVLHSDTEHGGHTGCSHSHGEHGHHNHNH
jgi:cation diffusion facilitator family transporter